MVTGNSEDRICQILVLSDKFIPENKFGHFTKLFFNVITLRKYVCDHIKDTDTFHFHVSDLYLKELLEKFVHQIEQVRRIYAYYDTSNALQSGQFRIQSGSEESQKLQFCLKRDLEKKLQNDETGIAVHPSQPIDRSTIDNITTLATERVSQKRTNQSDHHLAAPNEIAFNIQEDSWMENDILRFICPFCKFFFQEPYELECGHQQCKSCINHNNSCATCSKFILKDKARFDPCFQNEMQEFLSMCPKCKWRERWIFYQKHLNQNHQQFTNCSICNKQEAQSSSYEHYLNGMHQNNVKIIILDMQ
ncbi:unnamed protein product [Rotaria sp. Silwood2]|nr:unnamed protein product [Rotaria sp. Silwood2]